MQLLSRTEFAVTEVVYTFQDETSAFYYKELINAQGDVIDSLLRDKDGYQIDDPALLERVWDFITGVKKLSW